MHLFGELSVIECAQVKVAPCWFKTFARSPPVPGALEF
jgi:hypothetical protein